MLTFASLLERLEAGTISEVLDGVELKSSWSQDCGKDVSAIANVTPAQDGFMVIGIDDAGKGLNRDASWLATTESQINGHIGQYLSPTWAAKIQGVQTPRGHMMVLTIRNPGDVVEWNGKPYKLIGTSSREMSPDEAMSLSLSLPGQDYSKQAWAGDVEGALVLDFARKVKERGGASIPEDLSGHSPKDVLKRLSCDNKLAAGVLFADCPVRIAFYDDKGDVLTHQEKRGAYHLLTDDFIEQIQTWTRSRGTVIQGKTVSTKEEAPYPYTALREALGNGVAHALYERDMGDIIVDVHPNRLVVRNNCVLESKAFAQQWFSKATFARNKFLMRLLREAGVVDELGTGKTRLFAQMMEHGKREPTIEFFEKGKFGCWAVTLYNEEQDRASTALLSKLKDQFPSVDEARIAMALIHWRNRKWSEIQGRMDEHFRNMSLRVILSETAPVMIVEDQIVPKRWVIAALRGQESITFTEAEESQFMAIVQHHASSGNRDGKFSTAEARKILGLSNSPSEVTQLSNLFRKWRERGILEQGARRGEWRFKVSANPNLKVIMALLEKLNVNVDSTE